VTHPLSKTIRFVLLLSATACGLGPSPTARPLTQDEYLRSREMMVPVQGVSRRQLRDTYSAPRSGGRAHLALDIMASKGTRVLAADDGFILRIDDNELGGRTLYLSDPSRRFVYYYAHLDKRVYGLQEGQRVKRGQLLATVGTSGNAPKDAPHLHFQLMQMASGKRWWAGTPINPLPYLRLKGDER
jgi:murein DD-endopeptidase MepM/ murein hydrolase activator NlpD